MQVKVENGKGLERRLKICIPAQRVEQEIEKRLQKASKTLKLQGFRPGKVPVQEVRRRYGQVIRQEVLGDLTQSTFFEAVHQEKLTPTDQPRVESISNGGSDFEYVATFEVYPTINVTKFNTSIEKLVAVVTDQDVENMIDKLRKQHVQWKDINGVARKGDQVVIDYEGTVKGEKFPEGTGKNMPFELGAGIILPDFEEHLIGVKAGDEIAFKLKFPKDYNAKHLAGEEAEFKVKIHSVKEAELPEVNSEFVEKLGVKKGDVEEFRQEIRRNMERELAQILSNKLKEEVMNKMLELNRFELPHSLVEREIVQLQHQVKHQIAQQMGQDPHKLPDASRERFEEAAKRRVSLGLILAEFIKEHGMKADVERVRSLIEKIAAAYERPEEVVAWYYSKKEKLAQVESLVLEEQVVEKLLEEVKVSERKVSYDEAVKKS